MWDTLKDEHPAKFNNWVALRGADHADLPIQFALGSHNKYNAHEFSNPE